MRVLQVLWDGGGNTPPQLAIARELISRGHEVRMLGHRVQRERIEAAGAQFLPYRHAPESDASRPETDLVADWEARTPLGAFARSRDRLMCGPAAGFALDVIEALEERPAHVVAWDYLLLGAGCGAERAGVPSAAVVHTIYPLPTEGVPPFGQGLMPARGRLGRMRDAILARAFTLAFRPGLPPLNEARTGVGLPPLGHPFEQVAGADRLLVVTAAAFDFAGQAPVPENVRFVGPAGVGTPAGTWEPPWPADDTRPLVLASFSTTYMDQRDLLARTAGALGELPVRALVTTGPAIDPSRLPRADNVVLAEFVPHADVLPHASLVVTHAGMGTVHAALAAGVPLVCMPGGRDQADVAARVVAAGAGVRLRQGAGRARLREAVQGALADPSLAAGARRLGAELADRDGAAGAADELESLART